MRITIKSRGKQVSRELRELVERRVFHALGRFESHIAQVVVTLGEGPVSRCQVSVRGRTVWNVLVRDEDDWIATAVGRAMDRAARGVARRLDRQLNRRLARMQPSVPAHHGTLQEVMS